MTVLEPTEGFVEANGVRLHWLRWGAEGDGGRPPVLLLHATGFLARLWQPVAEALAPRYTVWAIDTRGHGDSMIVDSSQMKVGRGSHQRSADSRQLSAYHWMRFVEDVVGFMDAFGLRGIPVMGHSAGGATAGYVAATRPVYVSRLVMIEPIMRPPGLETVSARPHSLADGARKRRLVWASREEMIASYQRKETFAAWRPDVLRLYAEQGTRRLEGGDAVSGPFELKCWGEVEAQVFENSATLDLWERLPEIGCPTLVMRGEKTEGFLGMVAGGAAERIPGARLETVEGAGHLAPMERPGVVAEMMLAWLEAEEGSKR